MRRIQYWLIFILFLAILSGCSKSGYKVIVKDGEYFLQLGQYATDSDENKRLSVGPVIKFESIEEMRNDIQTGSFSEAEWNMLYHMADSSRQVHICNISELYEPIYPNSLNSYTVNLIGPKYYYTFFPPENFCRVYFYIQSEEYYNEKIDPACYEEISAVITSESDRDATVYRWQKYQVITYSISTAEKTLFVKESYDFDKSSTVPFVITIEGVEAGQYFEVAISSLQERPSVAWLSSFGLREYVEAG